MFGCWISSGSRIVLLLPSVCLEPFYVQYLLVLLSSVKKNPVQKATLSSCAWSPGKGCSAPYVPGTGKLDLILAVRKGSIILTLWLNLLPHLFLSFSSFPFHPRFCRGCPVECSDQPFGNEAHYLAIDWDESFLHLKYQSALEKVCWFSQEIYKHILASCSASLAYSLTNHALFFLPISYVFSPT